MVIMNKEIRDSFKERIESMFEFDSCPICKGKHLILESNKYEFVKFDVENGKIKIVGNNLDISTYRERIMCLECNWQMEFD